ncbi:MAG: hypothetical protein AB8B99_23485 [Phormidesmis sp.]
MRKLAIRLMSAGLVLGLGSALGAVPAMAQETGVANTAEDFKSAESGDGLFGSDIDIWDLMRRVNASGSGVADEGFYRSQGRRINREADSLRLRQRAILEQQEAEANQQTIPLELAE